MQRMMQIALNLPLRRRCPPPGMPQLLLLLHRVFLKRQRRKLPQHKYRQDLLPVLPLQRPQLKMMRKQRRQLRRGTPMQVIFPQFPLRRLQFQLKEALIKRRRMPQLPLIRPNALLPLLAATGPCPTPTSQAHAS